MALALLLAMVLAQAAPQPAPVEDDYTIGPHDILRITVFGHDDLAQTVVVQADGTFTYPLLGRVQVGDRTPKQLEAWLTERLGREFVRDPQVTVVVQEYRSKSVFVVGEIARPGSYPLSGSMSLIEVLSKAGPLGGSASGEVVIVRPAEGTAGPVLPADVRSDAARPNVEILRVDVREIEAGHIEKNVRLRPNDTIFVPQAPKVFISGEIRNPGAYAMTPRMTVRQLISLAGGLTEDGSPNKIRVVRSADGKSRETKIRIDEPIQAGDTIIVKAKLF